jgi:OOP family OmpA-OmpF porin
MRVFVSLLFTIFTILTYAQPTSSRYELVKMDKNINTFHHEAAPIVSPDGNTLYFFVQNHPENTYGKEDSQDIWVSKKDANGSWSPAQHLTSPFNIHRSNQVCTVLPEGNLFIKGGKSKNEKGFSIANADGRLRELNIKDFKDMNKGRFYGATISEDRKHVVLYFSEVPTSVNSDLYISHLQPDESYSRPVKLKLSTQSDDLGPFIGPDQKTLFFASARTAVNRQGGVDIYKSTRLDDTWNKWSDPINLGAPINTSALDFYFTMDNAGNVFTSRANKAFEGAQLDLYMLVPKVIKINLVGIVYNQKTDTPLQADVEINAKDQAVQLKTNATGKFETKISEVASYTIKATADGFLPKEITFKVPPLEKDTTLNIEVLLTPVAKKLVLTGNVYDQKTEKQIPAQVEIVARSNRKNSFKIQAEDGHYEQSIPTLGWYMISASAEGYISTSDSISIKNSELSPFTKDLFLQRIEVGVTVVLKNIYFDFDKTTLKKESSTELNKVVNFLKQNSTVEIEISGHTDNKGSDDYNLSLSQGRSQAVVDYLIKQGIESYRLTARGYGENKPIDTNDTDEGRANNRRVEFTVLKK